jgi:hypothetical protein
MDSDQILHCVLDSQETEDFSLSDEDEEDDADLSIRTIDIRDAPDTSITELSNVLFNGEFLYEYDSPKMYTYIYIMLFREA